MVAPDGPIPAIYVPITATKTEQVITRAVIAAPTLRTTWLVATEIFITLALSR